MTKRVFSKYRRPARPEISRLPIANLLAQTLPGGLDCPVPYRKGRAEIFMKISENLQHFGVVQVNNDVIKSGFPRLAKRESNERLQKNATPNFVKEPIFGQ